MSELPPPPQLSPDGKFYWDGERWLPYAPTAASEALVPVAPAEPEPPAEWVSFADWVAWAKRTVTKDDRRALAAAAAAVSLSDGTPKDRAKAATGAAFKDLAVVDQLDPAMVQFALGRVATVEAAGRVQTAGQPAAVLVRNYHGNARSVQQQLQRDAQLLAGQGYEVASQSLTPGRSGCMRVIMLGGIGALIFRPPDTLTVTYRRR
ncbi:MAG TPA: hypothetical protein VMU89_14030 [Thermomicrobiaceae bacterium]|nr:hypothetical protein [Thermomicrobiaceae bacterium]